MRQKLLQNAAAFVSQTNFIAKRSSFSITKRVNFITKCGRYYKTRRFYYKMRQVLQNASFITKRGVTRCTKNKAHLLNQSIFV